MALPGCIPRIHKCGRRLWDVSESPIRDAPIQLDVGPQGKVILRQQIECSTGQLDALRQVSAGADDGRPQRVHLTLRFPEVGLCAHLNLVKQRVDRVVFAGPQQYLGVPDSESMIGFDEIVWQRLDPAP